MVFKFNVPPSSLVILPLHPAVSSRWSASLNLSFFIRCAPWTESAAPNSTVALHPWRDVRQLYRDIVTRNEGCHSRTYGRKDVVRKRGTIFLAARPRPLRERKREGRISHSQRFYVLLRSSLSLSSSHRLRENPNDFFFTVARGRKLTWIKFRMKSKRIHLRSNIRL